MTKMFVHTASERNINGPGLRRIPGRRVAQIDLVDLDDPASSASRAKGRAQVGQSVRRHRNRGVQDPAFK